jgi:PPOX class probable FMN-dependent enzyme
LIYFGDNLVSMDIITLNALRQLYAQPAERAVKKQISTLDVHCKSFIALSPFALLATSDLEHNMDASPRGGSPGFIKVDALGRVLIPDFPGNNRLDSLENIIRTGKVGLLFLIPGFEETLRVNGSAVLSLEPEDITLCADERRAPKAVIKVTVEAAYLHCAKAFLRSKLWESSSLVPRETLPTAGKMMSDQSGGLHTPETRDDMLRRYAPDL